MVIGLTTKNVENKIFDLDLVNKILIFIAIFITLAFEQVLFIIILNFTQILEMVSQRVAGTRFGIALVSALWH